MPTSYIVAPTSAQWVGIESTSAVPPCQEPLPGEEYQVGLPSWNLPPPPGGGRVGPIARHGRMISVEGPWSLFGRHLVPAGSTREAPLKAAASVGLLICG